MYITTTKHLCLFTYITVLFVTQNSACVILEHDWNVVLNLFLGLDWDDSQLREGVD